MILGTHVHVKREINIPCIQIVDVLNLLTIGNLIYLFIYLKQRKCMIQH